MAFPGNSNFFDNAMAEINAEAENKRISNLEIINTNVTLETPEQYEHRLFLKRIIYNEDQPYENVRSYYELLISIYKNKDVELIKRLAANIPDFNCSTYVHTKQLQAVCSLLELFIAKTRDNLDKVEHRANIYLESSLLESKKCSIQPLYDTFLAIFNSIQFYKSSSEPSDIFNTIRTIIELNFPTHVSWKNRLGKAAYQMLYGAPHKLSGGYRKTKNMKIMKKNNRKRSRRVKPKSLK